MATLEKVWAETKTLQAAATLEKADAVAPLEKAVKKSSARKGKASLERRKAARAVKFGAQELPAEP